MANLLVAHAIKIMHEFQKQGQFSSMQQCLCHSFLSKQCIIKQLLDSVFVISGG